MAQLVRRTCNACVHKGAQRSGSVLVFVPRGRCAPLAISTHSIHHIPHTHTHKSVTHINGRRNAVNVVRRDIRPPFAAVFRSFIIRTPTRTTCDVSALTAVPCTNLDQQQPRPSRFYVQPPNMSQIGRPIKSLEAPRPLKSLSRPTLPSTTYEVQSSEYS